MKNYTTIVLFFLLTPLLIGCGSEQTPPTAAEKANVEGLKAIAEAEKAIAEVKARTKKAHAAAEKDGEK